MIKQKKLYVCILLLIFFILVGCSHSLNQSEKATSQDLYTNNSSCFSADDLGKAETIEENDYYKVIYLDFMFFYYIFDENQNIVKSDGPLNRQPHITMVSDHLVRFTLQAGTGIGTQWGYFYDTRMGVFSNIFHSIYDQCNGKVACVNVNKVIVRDIFDKNGYFLEISSFKESLSTVADPITNVEFTDGGESVKVTYLTGVNYQEISENFDLN